MNFNFNLINYIIGISADACSLVLQPMAALSLQISVAGLLPCRRLPNVPQRAAHAVYRAQQPAWRPRGNRCSPPPARRR